MERARRRDQGCFMKVLRFLGCLLILSTLLCGHAAGAVVHITSRGPAVNTHLQDDTANVIANLRSGGEKRRVSHRGDRAIRAPYEMRYVPACVSNNPSDVNPDA